MKEQPKWQHDEMKQVEDWLKSSLGYYEILSSHRVHDARTGVWRLTADSGRYFVKIHKEKRKWHPEIYAYKKWVSGYSPYAPKLIDTFEGDNSQGILLCDLEGVPLREVMLPEEKILRVYAKAGELTKQLHSLTVGSWFGVPDCEGQPLRGSEVSAIDYMRMDFYKWCGKALTDNYLEKDETKLAVWALTNFDVYKDEPAIPINNDYTPGNWLVDSNGEFAGVIDFECMQWGLQADSFAILWLRYFVGRPMLEDAFFAGYGSNLADDKPKQVRHVCIKIGIANIVWGIEHSNKGNIKQGRALLKRIAKDDSFKNFGDKK